MQTNPESALTVPSSTKTKIPAALEEAARKKPKKKAAKQDENGRYVKQEITTPGEE